MLLLSLLLLCRFSDNVWNEQYRSNKKQYSGTTTYNTTTGITTSFGNIASSTNGNFNGNTNNNYTIEWVGYFKPSTTCDHQFFINGNGVSYLWVGSVASTGYNTNNANINSNSYYYSYYKYYGISLNANTYYPIRIVYSKLDSYDDMQFGVSTCYGYFTEAGNYFKVPTSVVLPVNITYIGPTKRPSGIIY